MMMQMMSSMTYWMYQNMSYPSNVMTVTEDEYNWKQKKVMSDWYKKKKKQMKKSKKSK